MRRSGLAIAAFYALLLAASFATRAWRGDPAPALALREWPAPRAAAPVVVLLGAEPDAALLARFRVLAAAIGDASFAAQAHEVRDRLDAQRVARAHVVGVGD